MINDIYSISRNSRWFLFNQRLWLVACGAQKLTICAGNRCSSRSSSLRCFLLGTLWQPIEAINDAKQSAERDLCTLLRINTHANKTIHVKTTKLPPGHGVSAVFLRIPPFFWRSGVGRGVMSSPDSATAPDPKGSCGWRPASNRYPREGRQIAIFPNRAGQERL